VQNTTTIQEVRRDPEVAQAQRKKKRDRPANEKVSSLREPQVSVGPNLGDAAEDSSNDIDKSRTDNHENIVATKPLIITPAQAPTRPQTQPFIATSQGSRSPLWGTAGNHDAYFQAVKASRLNFAWNIEKTGTGVLLRNVDSKIHDEGSKIVVLGEEAIAARSAVQLAQLKGWSSINVDGGAKAVLRAVAVEAYDRGIAVRVDGRELTDAVVQSYRETQEQAIGQAMKR
jgi:hypothetical protein